MINDIILVSNILIYDGLDIKKLQMLKDFVLLKFAHAIFILGKEDERINLLFSFFPKIILSQALRNKLNLVSKFHVPTSDNYELIFIK